MKRQKAAALRTREISRGRECKIEGGWRDGGEERGNGAAVCREVFSMSLQSHIVPRKCHSALGRQRSEARLICLTAFTEMFMWPDPEEAGRRPTALCLPTNTPRADCFTQNVQ